MNQLSSLKKFYLLSSLFLAMYVFFILFNLESFTQRIYEARIYCSSFISDPFYEMTLGIYAFVLLYVITLKFLPEYHVFWIIKAFFTIFILILHESIRGLDAYLYYANMSCHLAEYYLKFDAGANIINLNHAFTYIVGNSYFSLKLMSSYIGFLGLIFLYKSYLFIHNNDKTDNFKYIIFLLPSILFWSSILGKDPLNLFCVGLFIYASLKFIHSYSLSSLLLIIIAIALAALIRMWYPIIMVIALSLVYLKINSIKHLSIFIILLIPGYYIMSGLFGFFGITTYDMIFEMMTNISKGFSYGNSSVAVYEIKSLGDYIKYFIPNTYTALFRPLPFEAGNPIMLISSIENTILLYLFFKYIILDIKIILKNKYLKFLLAFIFSWLLIYTILSQGNLGTAARFKLQVLPIMLILVFSAKKYKMKSHNQTVSFKSRRNI